MTQPRTVSLTVNDVAVQRRLSALGVRKVRAIARKAVREGMKTILRPVRDVTPVRTGALKKSLSVYVDAPLDSTTIDGYIRPRKEFVLKSRRGNYKTRFNAGQPKRKGTAAHPILYAHVMEMKKPYIRPTAERLASTIEAAMQKSITASVRAMTT
jgi:hypothetical protein